MDVKIVLLICYETFHDPAAFLSALTVNIRFSLTFCSSTSLSLALSHLCLLLLIYSLRSTCIMNYRDLL